MYFGKKINSESVNDYSILQRILERPGGLLTQIFDTAWTVKKNQFALTSFFFLFHATWVDCLSFPLWVVILLKMSALGFQFLLRVSSLKGPYVCRSISRWLLFGETSASQVKHIYLMVHVNHFYNQLIRRKCTSKNTKVNVSSTLLSDFVPEVPSSRCQHKHPVG